MCCVGAFVCWRARLSEWVSILVLWVSMCAFIGICILHNFCHIDPRSTQTLICTQRTLIRPALLCGSNVGVRLYPLRGCVSASVCVSGLLRMLLALCVQIYLSESICLNISQCVCKHAYACLWRSNLWRVSSSWRGEGFACREECSRKVLGIICYVEKNDQQKPLPIPLYEISKPQQTLCFH